MAQMNLPPPGPHPHHRLRAAFSLVAAIAGGLAVVGLIFALIGTVSPAKALGLWIGVVVLMAIWLTGIWWKTDAPDARSSRRERERRGF